MGAMQFVRGSHKRGLIPHLHADEPKHNLLIIDESIIDENDIVPCPLKKGGATFHDKLTLHYTAVNTTDRQRLAFPVEFETRPTRRAEPLTLPWVDARRAQAGIEPATHYVADGKYTRI
jgi:ectoine hydroxylase-related dioxygenase (phytanoyl-CoA dioxygenase family)